jgi:hypothetical protein
MSDNDLIRRGDAINACRQSVHRYEAHDAIDALPAVKPPALDAASDSIEAQAAEIERLRGDIERGLSVAKEIEKACRGLRDEAQPMTAKDATRLIIAALKGDKP